MSPAIDVDSQADVIRNLKAKAKQVDLSVFPDGLKTTGQHPPLEDKIYPYSVFPKHIEGPTEWKAEDYANNPERWVHQFSEEELEEISKTADDFIALGKPLTGINKDNFRLPSLEPALITMRRELINGKGFILYKGFPVDEWGTHKSAIAYMGLGAYLGYPVSQNGHGHILGHVKDLGEDSKQIDKVRIYRTNARQFFHADDSDIVGLLCISKAEFGGESDVASIHNVWNILQAERPDVAELLTQPIWYFDRKGEVSAGEDPYIKAAVFYLEPPEAGREQRVYCKWDPYFVRSLSRFSDAGVIPPLSAAQDEAARLLEATCERVKLHMVLAVGDIQFVANSHTLHARTAYRDFGPDSGRPRRHLMRLWLSVPEDEGGWRLPYWDSAEKKRGGIQVDDTPPVARLDAD
ncbi:Clavaminate synthase-like protein [Hypoxylon sp. FL1284]|nr:Clavaminate synthase-like protein [Hypoxylon sp. FL1284]